MKTRLCKRSFSHFLPHLIIIGFGVGISVLFFVGVRFRERAYLEREFHRSAQNRVSVLDRYIQNNLGILESVSCFFESSQFVDREEFSSFTSSFSELEGIFIIAWAPIVADADRQAFEAQVASEGFADYRIKELHTRGEFIPAQRRSEYVPVLYIEPFNDENRNVLGYDCASEARRYRAITQARDLNLPVATEAIHLIQDREERNSFLVFVPVYGQKMPVDTVNRRQENIKGFVIGAFYISSLVNHAMSYTDVRHICLHLSDLSAPDDNQFLCSFSPDSSANSIPADLAEAKPAKSLYFESIIYVGTRQWSIVCTPGSAFVNLYLTGNEWTTLAIGLLLTLSVYLYFLFSWRKTEAVQRLVDVRTEELREELVHRTQAEKKLSRTAQQLEIKNDELERVIYIASHDLRSPLVTISGFDNELQKSCQKLNALIDRHALDEKTRVAVNDLLDEAIPESIRFIHTGVEKADMLINGLLQISRIGTSPFKIEPLDMNALMLHVVDSHRFQARQAGAEITIEPLPDCMGDASKTNQVFSNLITNAIKYLSPDRPGKVIITGYPDEDSRSVYCVADNGIGIDPEHHTRIFQMFNRACQDPAITGDGLGLSIVTRILEGQDGEIWVESEPDKGSRFFVSLPKA
jgi:signal transduction histidine kinase